MTTPEKKSGLQKKVSSIFEGIPEMDDLSVAPAAPAPVPTPFSPVAQTPEPSMSPKVTAPSAAATTEEFLKQLRAHGNAAREFEAYAVDGLKRGMAARIGVDLGERQYKLVRLDSKLRLQAIACHEWSDSLESEIAKEIKEGAFRELIAKINAESSPIVMGLPGEAVSYQVIRLPALPKAEMVKAARWELTKKGLMDPGHSLVDCVSLVSKSTDRRVFVLAIAVRDADVTARIQLAEDAGLFVEDVQTTVQALDRIVRQSQLIAQGQDGVVLELGFTTSTLCFFHGNALQYARTFAVGAKECIAAIRGVVKVDGQTFTLTDEDAMLFLRHVGIPTDEMLKNSPARVFLSQITARVRPVLEGIVEELRRSLEFYVNNTGLGPVQSLHLSGGMALTKNLDTFLGNAMGITTNILRPFELLGISIPPNWKASQSALSVALGLSMEGGLRLNLLPEKNLWQARERKVMRWTKLVTATMVSGILVIGGGLGLWSGKLGEKVDSLSSSCATISDQVGKCKRILVIQKTIREREQLIVGNALRQPVWEGILKEISNSVPDNVVLTELSLIRHSMPKTLRLVGSIYADNLSADSQLSSFEKKMTYSPYFQHFELNSRKNVPGASPSASSFEIHGVLQY